MKSNILFTAISIFLSGSCSLAQTGFFLVVTSKENCPHLVKTVDYKQSYCIPLEPIISGKEFRVEGDLQYDRSLENQFFALRLTKEGLATLKLICANLPEKQLVLVVNGRAAGLYDTKNLKPEELMSISGKANTPEFHWVYDNLNIKNKD